MWRQRGEGTSPIASHFSQRNWSLMCRIQRSWKTAACPSSMPQPPKRYAFSLAATIVWPERARGVPLDLGFSLGVCHIISPDLASLVLGAMVDRYLPLTLLVVRGPRRPLPRSADGGDGTACRPNSNLTSYSKLTRVLVAAGERNQSIGIA